MSNIEHPTMIECQCPPDMPERLAAVDAHVQAIGVLETWTVIKTILWAVQTEVNFPVAYAIYLRAEAADGGGYKEILKQLLAQADVVFPDPNGRAIAVGLLRIYAFLAGLKP